MKIVVVGAGNIGLALTSYLSVHTENNEVTLYTKKPILKYGCVRLVMEEENKQFVTSNFSISSSLETFCDADIILCTYPAFLRKEFINDISSYVKVGNYLGFVPGYGGAEYMCKELIKKGVIVFGLQRVPYVARYDDNGCEINVSILSKKEKLYIASIPYLHTRKICSLIENLLNIPVEEISQYLSITLAPSNPLLHIAGLYGVFKDYKPSMTYNKQMRFYEEWNDETSKLLLDYDDEVQVICKHLYPLELHEVVSLRTYYESETYERMTKKLKSIKSFEAVLVPLKKIEEDYIPDFDSRMFIEDFPFGVCMFKAYALMADVECPIIDMLLSFYERLTGIQYFKKDGTFGKDIETTGIPQLYGFNNKEEIIDFYEKIQEEN